MSDGWIEVGGERITALGALPPPGRVDLAVGGGWIVPGFVDLHAHGGGGATVAGADPEQVAAFAATHLRHGTTSILASLSSAGEAALDHDLRALAELAEDGVVAGIHLEGPWLSPRRKGAHPASALRVPEPGMVARLLSAGRGAIRMVTLAPELEHGLDAVRAVTYAGALAAVGHTDADAGTTRAAIEAGATVATHLFNAMAPIHHREPGPIVALLADDRVTVELVLDGVHLDPAIARHACVSAGPDRVVLVTDAMQAAGRGDGRYPRGDISVTVHDGATRLPDGTLAGSALTMDAAFRFAITRAGFTIQDAVRATSTTPARLLGISSRTGALRPGLAADLVVLDADHQVVAVMREGAWVSTG
ncbi:N-acetylglucosamine-6-phosphate deacetylase [Jiangella muralis]|uniref:N-acetylglucosamine-6-phosphate deacetylase n=1 Tax=Jiangella muralis TaxID=702383 RepID=UPI001F0B015A|nr:N-acetylglucosamine-6-phosphate deacetylase [Jiangella muralis]